MKEDSFRSVDMWKGVVEMILSATQRFSKPLTKEQLFDWHAALFPSGRSGMHRITIGNWRPSTAEPMRVISGPVGHEKIHYEAPHADTLEDEMKSFLAWFNKQK